MEVLKKIFLVFFFGIVLLFVGLSIYIQKNGKALIEEKLSAALQKEVHVGKARLLFPLGLRFDNVEIKDALKAKVLRIHLGLPLFFDGHFNIARIKLTEPVFFFTYAVNNKIVWGKTSEVVDEVKDSQALAKPRVMAINFADLFGKVVSTDSTSRSAGSLTKKNISRGVIIDYLEVKDGKIKIESESNISLVDIGHINLKAMDVALPAKDMKTRFDFTAWVLSDNVSFAGQKIEARGMVNFIAKDMDATVRIVDKVGNFSFSAHYKSVKNDMTVKGKINIARFISGIKTKDSKESSLEGFLSTALESSGVDISVDFACETKMDDFNFEKLGMSGNVVQTQKKP